MYKLQRNILWAVRVKFGVLISFFMEGRNQVEGSNAVNVKRRMKNLKGWLVSNNS